MMCPTAPDLSYLTDGIGIFAGGAVIGGVLLRSGPLYQTGAPPQAAGGVTTAQAEAGPALPA
jgi:hypothetical protein